MDSKTNKKVSFKSQNLPLRFQEVLAESEIQLEEGISVYVLKKLVYLYTMAMQHYHLDNNQKLQDFYNKKLISLLTRPDVTEYLDKNHTDINDHSDLNLFPEEQQKNTKKLVRQKTFATVSDYAFNKEMALQTIRKKMGEVDAFIDKITQAISKDVLDQMMNYNEKIKNLKNQVNTSTAVSNEDSESSDNDDEFFANIQKQKEMEISKDSNNNDVAKKQETRRLSMQKHIGLINSVVLDETEAYIKKSIEEENREIAEINAEYEKTIKDLPSDLASAYLEERDEEIRNLQSQYEDKRAKDLEKLKKKH